MIQRSNDLEQRMFEEVQSIVRVRRIYHGAVSPDHLKRILSRCGSDPTIFVDAPSPYRTMNDNYKRTEGVIFVPKFGIYWRVECKSQKRFTDLAGRVLLELNFVANLFEDKYCLILENALMLPKFLKIIDTTIREKNLENKVWRGTLEDFKVMLKNRMKK